MSVLKPRNRIVYFRVSEEEFQRFNDLCKIRGARSLSDLFRSAVKHFADGKPDNSVSDDLSEKLDQLDEQLSALNRRLDEISTPSPRQSRDVSWQYGGGES